MATSKNKPGRTLLKDALARFVPGLMSIPEDLLKKFKPNSAKERRRQKELEEFMQERERKVIEAVRWLSHDGYFSLDTLNCEQFNRLIKTKKERELYIKVSNVQGGLYCAYCTVHRVNAEELAGRVDLDANKLMRKYHLEVEAWDNRKEEYDKLMGMTKKAREELMIKKTFYYKGKRGKKIADYSKLIDWLGDYPQLPDIEAPKKNHKVRSVKIVLYMVTERTVVRTKSAVTQTGKPIRKKYNKIVTTTTAVKEIVTPLPDDIHNGEIPRVIDNTVARFPRGGGLPEWNKYSYEVLK